VAETPSGPPGHDAVLARYVEIRDDALVSTVAEIKEAIARLSPQEYCELMADLFPHADDEWDKQMKADAEAG
jgi:predicted MarR family transcription regulator